MKAMNGLGGQATGRPSLGPSFEYREIEIADATASGYAVVSGLAYGEEVVTNGAFVIDASAQLNNQVSMMNKNVMAKNAVHSNHLPDYTNTTPQIFKEQLTAIASTYLLLKDALVASDQQKAAENVNDILDNTEKVDMSLVKDKAHIYWMEQLKAIQTHGKKIAETEDLEDLDAQDTAIASFCSNAGLMATLNAEEAEALGLARRAAGVYAVQFTTDPGV
ncbi:MAG: DUF3347 domain-containing protein, partial [Ardenticatenaceae bacterium]